MLTPTASMLPFQEGSWGPGVTTFDRGARGFHLTPPNSTMVGNLGGDLPLAP